MRVLPFTDAAHLAAAVEALREVAREHGVTAIPTETFYGLAVPPADAVAVERVVAMKGRSAEKRFPVVGATLEQLDNLVRLEGTWRRRLAAVWPAPLTVVLPAAARGGGTLAVRVPAHPLLRALLAEVGPLTATSANRSGAPAHCDPSGVGRELGAELDLLLDGGATAGGLPSTLVDLTSSPPRRLRPGAFHLPPEWGVKEG